MALHWNIHLCLCLSSPGYNIFKIKIRSYLYFQRLPVAHSPVTLCIFSNSLIGWIQLNVDVPDTYFFFLTVVSVAAWNKELNQSMPYFFPQFF